MKRFWQIIILLVLCTTLLAGCATSRTLNSILGTPSTKISTTSKEDPVKVRYLTFSVDDEHGIVSVDGSFKNQSGKTIKDVRFTLKPFDKNGEEVCCRERQWSSVVLEEAGPWVPGGVSYQHWPKVWYSFSVSSIALESIEIFYLDGTMEILP